MNKYFLYTQFVVAILLLSCQTPKKEINAISDEDYRVMESIIQTYFIDTRYPTDTLKFIRIFHKTIKSEIIKGNTTDFITEKWNKDSLFTIRSIYEGNDWDYLDSNFTLVSQDTLVLDSSKFHFSANCIFVNDEHYDQKHHARISGSTPVICLSRVGFDKTHDMALITFFAPRSGFVSKSNVLLKKVNNKWINVDRVYYWDGDLN
jgi:hypothetical protein